MSVSGTATSLNPLAPVLWRVGSCVGAAAFSAGCETMSSVGDLRRVFVSVRTGRLMVEQIYNMKLWGYVRKYSLEYRHRPAISMGGNLMELVGVCSVRTLAILANWIRC